MQKRSTDDQVEQQIGTKQSASRHCEHCGYNLRGLKETRCPECGEQFDPSTNPALARFHDYAWKYRLRLLLLAPAGASFSAIAITIVDYLAPTLIVPVIAVTIFSLWIVIGMTCCVLAARRTVQIAHTESFAEDPLWDRPIDRVFNFISIMVGFAVFETILLGGAMTLAVLLTFCLSYIIAG